MEAFVILTVFLPDLKFLEVAYTISYPPTLESFFQETVSCFLPAFTLRPESFLGLIAKVLETEPSYAPIPVMVTVALPMSLLFL